MNYIPDSVYAPFSVNNLNFCSNKINTLEGVVTAPERASEIKCPFGTNDSFNKGIFFKETQLPYSTWGRVPQLNPRSLNKIGMEWRN